MRTRMRMRMKGAAVSAYARQGHMTHMRLKRQ
jgi:hypothetical protein